MNKLKTLRDFLASSYWESYEQAINSNMAINNPERLDRGSTHAEIIQDWREAIADARRDGEITDADALAITAEIDRCEDYHTKQNTLENQID